MEIDEMHNLQEKILMDHRRRAPNKARGWVILTLVTFLALVVYGSVTADTVQHKRATYWVCLSCGDLVPMTESECLKCGMGM